MIVSCRLRNRPVPAVEVPLQAQSVYNPLPPLPVMRESVDRPCLFSPSILCPDQSPTLQYNFPDTRRIATSPFLPVSTIPAIPESTPRSSRSYSIPEPHRSYQHTGASREFRLRRCH